MATRYSGNATVHIRWDDKANVYQVTISVAGENVWSGKVGAPKHLTHAVDSPEAYDATAIAAIAFYEAEAEEGRVSMDAHPAYNAHGRIEVARSKKEGAIEESDDDITTLELQLRFYEAQTKQLVKINHPQIEKARMLEAKARGRLDGARMLKEVKDN